MSTPPTTFEILDRRLGITTVWQRGVRGSGVTVAVVDTGITPDSDLAPSICCERDFTGEGNPRDRPHERRHGTEIARLVHLVAPEAAIANFKVFPRRDTWVPFRQRSAVRRSVGQALEHCLAEHPRYRVVNLSLSLTRGWWFWRCAPGHRCAVCRAVNRAAEAGTVVVTAAGNYGPRPNTIECPGLAEGAITVGATLTSAETDSWQGAGNQSGPFGTSFSTAYAAGGVALLLSAYADATPDDVRAALAEAARPLPGQPPNAQGAGLTHFGRALEALEARMGPSEAQFNSVQRQLYFLAGNGDAQRPDNAFVTQPLTLALDYVEKGLIRRGRLQSAAEELQTIRGYLVPGHLPEYEQRIRRLMQECQHVPTAR
ncbi:MAG: S8 family serine peptidase [Candidatus Brocadiae bacterium]|nr:S8 family serine peptidase [Candidatus Brocadiia bacterium]